MSTKPQIIRDFPKKYRAFEDWCRANPTKGFSDLLVQRDALLAASKVALSVLNGNRSFKDTQDMLREAIALAEKP